MPIELGRIEAIFRYPIKSMAGESLESADLGWHGIEGDRRIGVRRVDDQSGFPWLTATKLPDLIRFRPLPAGTSPSLPTHVRTPSGEELPVFSDELSADIARRYGSPVQMLHVRHGVFDDASISVIATDTVDEIARLSSTTPDVRRFRPNLVVRLLHPAAFAEDAWLGANLTFGSAANAPTVAVTMHDVRCSMVNLDPESAHLTPEVLKSVVRANGNHAGIYGTVTHIGRLEVGQPIFLHPCD